jgi:glycosyltransferase involved in cell wall biosynthesis
MVHTMASRDKPAIGVFHPGTQHSWQTARALQDLDELEWYATSVFWLKDKFPYNAVPWLPTGLRNRIVHELRRFHHPALDPRHVVTASSFEILTRLTRRMGLRSLAKVVHHYSNVAFAAPVINLTKRAPVRAVWGYDTSSLEVFRFAKSCGIRTILDRTIGHPVVYNSLMDEIYDRYADFFANSNYRISNSIIDRVDAEHSLADIIVVGSAYCASTLTSPPIANISSDKIRMLNYCYDDVFFRAERPKSRKKGEPVKFLFVGLAVPRKGIHLVLKVFQRIPPSAATLTILGEVQVPKETFGRFADRLTHIGTVPRPDVSGIMREFDYLVFPTYFEGAGITLYEAMALGLGIIQSMNADVVLPTDSALLMKQLSEDELYRCVMTAIEDFELLHRMSDYNLKKVQLYNYTAYRDRVREITTDV